MSARHFFRNNWPTVAIAVTAAAIACAAVVLLSNLPPHTIVMATGPEGGTYYELGKRYRALLARDNIEVQLVPTAGSIENLAKLLDPRSGVGVALMQGGIGTPAAADRLESLGTVFYEPYWWFLRSEIADGGVPRLLGRKISIGAEGSGTRALSLQMLGRVGINAQNTQLLALSPRETAEQLEAGDIDVAFLIAAWGSPVVQQLFADDRIALSSYQRADALIALFPFLTKLVVPQGAIDLLKNKPPADITLIGSKASLIVRNDLHPAIQYLLLNAATEIHSEASIFNRANAFPAAEAVDVPLSSEAVRFYKSGRPILHEYFPFWMAELIGKLIILLIPILGVLYPMTRFLPRVYDWAVRSKILRVYGELRLLEDRTSGGQGTESDRRELADALDRLEEQVNRLKMPLSYSSMMYELRTHIGLVRQGLAKRAAAKS